MNLLMSFKLRRNGNNKGNTRRWQSGRNSSTRSPIPGSLLSNNQGSLIRRSGQGPHNPSTTHSHKWQLVAPATTMGSHVGPVEAQIGTHKVGILVVGTTLITQIVEAKVVGATIVGPIRHKAVGLLMLGVGCLGQVVLEEELEVVGVMGLELQTTRRVVHTVVQVLGEDKTWVVTATSHITGSNWAE